MSTKLVLLIFIIPCLISAEPIELTDKTWGRMLEGQWMVEFYAPWCGACRQFKPIWSDFATAMESKQINVGAVDVDKYPALSGRFGITALPTVYHVHDGVFRQYDGGRSLKNLEKYINNEQWKETKPVASHFAPNSLLMSLTSSLFGLSNTVRDTHDLLQDYYAWPSWLIYTVFVIGVLAVGILIGFGTLQILDYFLSGIPRKSVNTIPDEEDDLEGSDSEEIMISKKQTTDESEGDEEVKEEEDDDDDDDNEENPGKNEEGEPATSEQTLRQRH